MKNRPDNTNPLTRGDILRCVGAKSYARGKEYFDQGRVTSLQVDHEEAGLVDFSSVVQGSGHKRYQQDITLEWDDRDLDISGFCTCPVRYDCKHIAAACLQYETKHLSTSHKQNSTDPGCFAWLDAFTGADQPLSPTHHHEFLTYLLKPSKQPGILEVGFQITRLLKKGGLGKPRNTTLNNICDDYRPAAYVQPADEEIGKLLKVNNSFNWHGVQLQGELGFLALSKMLQTGRCYWRDIDAAPLEAGEERPLALQWQRDAQGNATLKLSITPESTLLLTEPALYLDPKNHCIGPLTNAPFSAKQLEQLVDAPAVPAPLAQQFSQRMAQRVPATILPPPQAVETEEVTGTPPVPCLQLSAREREGHHYHIMRLRYRYGAHEITALPEQEVSHLTEGEKVVHVWRNLEQESQTVEQLQALGFEGMVDQNRQDIVFLSLGVNNPIEGLHRWQTFLTETAPQLQQQGWQIEYDASFNMVFHQADHWDVEIKQDGQDWFDLRFDIEINQQPLALLPLIAQVLEHYSPDQLPEVLTLHLGDNQYLSVASEQIKPVLDVLFELYNKESLQKDGSLRLSRFDAVRLTELDEQPATHLQWRNGDELRQLGRQLKDFQGIQAVTPPQGLNATLRHYQQQGLNWLQFLREYRFGGILADDMGLGKTVQTLSHLLLEKEQGRMDKPCLIIAPTSLMSNWQREAAQFTPALKVLILQGPNRHQHFDVIDGHDLVLSTYPLLARDGEILQAHHYHALILDEAQMIKNPKAKAAQIIRQINTDHRLCLTGTPMENHLGELWALFDFLMPGFLGDNRQFNQLFRTPIEQQGDGQRRQQLANRVAPFMLRRSKLDVLQELPEKTEITRTVTLDTKQAALYESIRLSMEKKVRQAIANQGLARSHITILDALLKLRQVCCDPRLLPLAQASKIKESAKLELLMQMLPEMVEEGRRILLFSQFTKMLGHIEAELNNHNIRYSKLTGQTRNRDAAIEKFKNGEADVFLISLKAGGVGLNLTEADTVIHYDPWWNPAAENQATDRAHRIGQHNPVFVYKLVTENSVEEKIIALQAKKQALAQGVYGKNAGDKELSLKAEDMQQLFAPLV